MNLELPSFMSHKPALSRRRWIWAVFGAALATVLVAPAARAVLYVSSYNTDNINRYDENTGAYLSQFSAVNPAGFVIGPDGHFYVASYPGSYSVHRYNGVTGADMGAWAGFTFEAYDLVFGSDGHVYGTHLSTGRFMRLDGTTGDYLATFGFDLAQPRSLVFGPDGDLFVSEISNNTVRRYDGTTFAAEGAFASGGGLSGPQGIVFGPDGNLYVASYGTSSIKRYNGTTGAYMDDFATGGGLGNPTGLLFGPDDNLYVADYTNDRIARYNGQTGAYMDIFASGGGLDAPLYLFFSNTNPGTLQMQVPEPSVGLLFGGGLALLALARRRTRQREAACGGGL
ncbi:MAG: NHL repeat-containing protein [Verrucomicrobia bacterium]|nr:NHL repeat-containing protein [Verrucomicrobiota bacterium]